MHNSDYTVLAAATCETDITGKLPRKSEFRKAKPLPTELKTADEEKMVVVEPLINVKDYTSDLVNYKFSIAAADRDDMEIESISGRLADKKFRLLPSLAAIPQPDAKVAGVADGLIAQYLLVTDIVISQVELQDMLVCYLH